MAKILKQSTIKVRSETGDQIRFLHYKSGLSTTQLLAEIIDSVFQIGCTFSSINFEYEYDITNSQVTISLKGKNNLKSGSFEIPSTTSNKKVDKMIAKRVKKND
jgi:hypothetical protein